MSKNMWELFLEMTDLTEEMDRKSLRKAKERNVEDKERLDKEIDRLMAEYLELKHKLERINID